jgi:HTH-type transcriptional regulator / antitoxin HigA
MEKVNINELLRASFNKDIDLSKMFEDKAKEHGMTVTQARELLGIERKSLAPILAGEAKQPNLITVLKIAEFLEIDLREMVVSLLSKQASESISKLVAAKTLSFLAKKFDIERLYKEKFITSKTDSESITERLLSFWGFNDIYELENYEEKLSVALFSQTKRKFVDKMRDFAIVSAFRLFELIDNPNEYNRNEVKDLIPKIKPYCRDIENGLYTVVRALYNHGVTVILQKHLSTTQYKGATFIVNKKPCIVLTDLNKNYPAMWLALLHELYHVLFDYEQIEKSGYHLTGQPEIFLHVNEEFADDFASEFFFGKEMYNYIKTHIHSDVLVENFAKKHNIDKSFVYGGFQHFISKEGGDYWKAFKIHFPDINKAVSKLNPMTWNDNKTLPALSESLKLTFELTT